MSPRAYQEPVLWLAGRRSIVGAWPPTAVCERCGQSQPSGYAGPSTTDHEVRYPDPDVHFVCKRCARSAVGLGLDDLTGHICHRMCTDTVHVEPQYVQPDSLSHTDEQSRIEHYRADYARRGWTVFSVIPAVWMPPTSGDRWAVLFEPAVRTHD